MIQFMQWFIYTCEMYTHLFIYMKWNYFLPFFPMQYLNKNLWDTLGDVFFSFYKQHQICTMLERKKKKEREKLSVILKSWNLGKKILIITTKCLDTVIQSIEDV